MTSGRFGREEPMSPAMFFGVRLPTLLALWWRRYVGRTTILRSTPERVLPHAVHSRKEPLSFIIFRLDSMGDVVMTTPLFRELKKSFPDSHLTVVVQEPYRPLLTTNPHINEVLAIPKVKARWLPAPATRLLSALRFYWEQLRPRHFDIAIVPRWDTDEHLATLLCLLTNAAQRVGYSEAASTRKTRVNGGFDAAFSLCLPAGPLWHEVFRNLEIVKVLGGKVSDSSLEIRLTDRDRRKAMQLLQTLPRGTQTVAVGIGAQSAGRRWPLERYAETLLRLHREQPVQPVIVCSGDERRDAEHLAALLRLNTIIVSGSPVRQVCAVLERCQLFLGNDSGCAHLAAAMNCKTIVISRHPRSGDPNHFNSPLRFAPHGSYVRVLQPMTGLGDCHAACSHTEPHCITGVSVDDAAGTARELLHKDQSMLPVPARPWPSQLTRYLLNSHSADAVRQAVEALQGTSGVPTIN